MGKSTISMAIFNSELFFKLWWPPCSPGRVFSIPRIFGEEGNGNLVLKSIIYTEIYNLIKDTSSLVQIYNTWFQIIFFVTWIWQNRYSFQLFVSNMSIFRPPKLGCSENEILVTPKLGVYLILPIGSMVLVYMQTWLGYIDGIHVTIYIYSIITWILVYIYIYICDVLFRYIGGIRWMGLALVTDVFRTYGARALAREVQRAKKT